MDDPAVVFALVLIVLAIYVSWRDRKKAGKKKKGKSYSYFDTFQYDHYDYLNSHSDNSCDDSSNSGGSCDND